MTKSMTCVVAALVALGMSPEGFGGEVTVVSPSGEIALQVTEDAGKLSYTLRFKDRTVIKDSPVGFQGKALAGVKETKHASVWHPLWGKRTEVEDKYNGAILNLTSYTFEVRAYDDGVAFRSVGAEGEERTRFDLAGDYTAWAYNGEQHNVGPDKVSEIDGTRRIPVTLQAADDLYLALLEADLPVGEPLLVKSEKGSTAFTIASKPTSAWRVVMCASTPGRMVDSHMIELLNPAPSPDDDFSWVKPGVMLWDWRTNGAKVGEFQYAMSYPSWVRLVDFAAENGFPYLLLDADWYGKEFNPESNPTSGGYAGDAREIIRYGKTKGVGIVLYLNDVAGRAYPLEHTLATYASWGAAGIKYGFMNGNMAEKNARTQMITKLCAKYKLLCNYHDYPAHPFGQMRTWPNAITREFCQAQLDGHRVFQPKTFVTSVFVNMLAGPIDMNNGLADLIQANRVDEPSRVPSTLAGEVARTIITFSGATVIPDLPENYRKYANLLAFYRAEKQPWQESRTLAGEIGRYIVMARRNAEGAWLVGAATNEDARELDIPLDFLGEGEFDAVILEDGADAHYAKQIESYQIKGRRVTSKDVIRVKLAPGGGAAVMFR